MGESTTDRVEARATRHRPRSRGVPAPARKSRNSSSSRLRGIWATMYPLPRMLITTALLVAIAYGIVAFFVLAPARAGVAVYLWGIPILAGAGIWILARGEPNDQTTVHHPHHNQMSEAEFDALEDRVDRLAREPGPAQRPDVQPSPSRPVPDPANDEKDFQALVAQAIDDLPQQFAHALDHVAVVVSNQGTDQRINGRRQPLYGLYVGYGGRSSYRISAPTTNALPDRIVIFRDTLVHDFGNDPTRLREQVTRTLRHELAHHLGWDEKGVQGLGL